MILFKNHASYWLNRNLCYILLNQIKHLQMAKTYYLNSNPTSAVPPVVFWTGALFGFSNLLFSEVIRFLKSQLKIVGYSSPVQEVPHAILSRAQYASRIMMPKYLLFWRPSLMRIVEFENLIINFFAIIENIKPIFDII